MSWLNRHLNLDQLPGPQQSSSSSRPPRENEQPLRLLSHQIRSTFLSNRNHTSTVLSAPSSTIVRPASQPNPVLDEPPPAYHTLFPQGAPVGVDLDLATIPTAHQQSSPRESLPSDCDAWDLSSLRNPKQKPNQAGSRQDGHVRSRGRPRRNQLTVERITAFEHYNLGVDPSVYKTTRIDMEGATHLFIVTPRNSRLITNPSHVQSPRPARIPSSTPAPSSAARVRPWARVPVQSTPPVSPPVVSIQDDDEMIDYTAPDLHRVHQAHVPVSIPATADTSRLVAHLMRDSGGHYSIVADPADH